MSTDLTPDQPAINEQQPVEQAPPEPPAPSPWQQWEQAGVDPTVNPYEARQALDAYQALRDRDRQVPYIESIMRANNLLPEGVSLQDAIAYANEQAQYQQDPWAQFSQPQQQQFDQGYDPALEQQYQQPPFDPSMLQQAVQAEVQRNLQAYQAQQEEAMRVQQFETAATQVASTRGYGDQERHMVSAEAVRMLQMNPALTYEQALGSAADAYDQAVLARAARLGQQQQAAPQIQAPTGPPPAQYQQPQSLQEAERQIREMIRQGQVPG